MTIAIKPLGWIVLGVLGLGTIALIASEPAKNGSRLQQVKGLPNPKGVNHSIDAQTGWLVTSYNGQSVSLDRPKQAIAYALLMRKAFSERAALLPKDAKGFGDRYTKELYYLPSWVLVQPVGPNTTSQQLLQWQTSIAIDEFGRVKPGKYGSTGSLSDVFTNLLANPLMKVVISAAAIALGPGGIAALGAYNYWQARGQELSLKNAVLITARAYAVSQCGAACGVAFDFGVGVASGEDVDIAAEKALYQNMGPQERAAYNQGKQAYQEMT